MLYTRKGDSGTSGLLGTKERFSKDSPVYEALGTLDEINSLLGLCRAKAAQSSLPDLDASLGLLHAQECLFIAQAELAGADKTLSQEHLSKLEQLTGEAEACIENPHSFVIPGETELSALLDYARTVSRRAERSVIRARQDRTVGDVTLAYLNRLSSYLYALARVAATRGGNKERTPGY